VIIELRRYGLANVMAMRTVVAGPDGFAAITVQAPARWAGSSGKCSEQTSCEPLRLHAPDWWDEMRMFEKTAPYQVRILTATSVDARAVTLTSNPYLAGLGALITYWAEVRPFAIIRLATCGLPMTLVVRACSSLCWPLLLPPVQPALPIASRLAAAKKPRFRPTTPAYEPFSDWGATARNLRNRLRTNALRSAPASGRIGGASGHLRFLPTGL